MSLRDELLNPISGDNPAGADLRYDNPVYDKIKDARREDDDAPQGEWAVERKTADWPTVIKLSKELLAEKTKDLQLAVWLTDAMVRREGFGGLAAGLDMTAGIVDAFWDNLYPEIDEDGTDARAALLDWVGSKLEIPVRMVGLDKNGLNSFQYKEARLVPNEAAAGESREKADARKAAIADGKKTPEDLEAAFTATPKAWLKALIADIEGSRTALAALDKVSTQRFGNSAPSFSKLRDTLDEISRTAGQQLKRKLEVDPDPIDTTPAPVAELVATSSTGAAASGSATTGGSLTAEPTSRVDAASRIVSAAKYLRQTDPFNPASYLILRGFRWGELRVSADGPDPRLLEAPATAIRTTLRGFLLDSRWPELLEASEGVMGTAQGRGWIDLQRYALTACDAMGPDYTPAATAIRGALRAMLTDLPQLLDMTLMDDTPTANAETRSWLRVNVLLDGDPTPPPPRESGMFTAIDDRQIAAATGPFALANAEAKAGRTDRAIALLMREASRQKTSRARFLCQVQLARVMIEAGHNAVAMPVLEQLVADIDNHKLEEWEAGEVVAAPLALLYRALGETDPDGATRNDLYLRICRLDPLQAITFARG